MRLRLVALTVLLAFAAVPGALAEAPRDIWPQVTSAARDGDLTQATKKANDLTDTGRAYGLKTYPLYATAAAGLSYQSDRAVKKELAGWAAATTTQLDPKYPAVAFTLADEGAAANSWGKALPTAVRGLVLTLSNYRTRLLGQVDLLVVLSVAVALTTILFAISLFIRYGRSMGHDFRETLGRRLRGGSVSVLGFALLFLPIFLWLGPMWLVFYWLIIFFGYANARERSLIVILGIVTAALPLVLDLSAHWGAGVESPVVMSAISSQEGSYQPEALRRLNEVVTIVPDNPTLHILLGNMYVYEGNEQEAADHYRQAIQINDPAGAHVNLGNLHFLQNDYVAAITEYGKAQKLDPELAIAFYNDSVASGETYKFQEQGQKLERAKKVDQKLIENLSQNPPAQKIAMYHPSLSDAWAESAAIARKGVARSLFGNYSYFDPQTSAMNPVTIGGLTAVLLAMLVWMKRRRAGYAGS
ncbi:MAG: tetratricopeptide repeat protein, partial [Thermoanaerobaculia bacterium]